MTDHYPIHQQQTPLSDIAGTRYPSYPENWGTRYTGEEITIVLAQKLLGKNDWAQFAAEKTGRSVTSIKSAWNRLQRQAFFPSSAQITKARAYKIGERDDLPFEEYEIRYIQKLRAMGVSTFVIATLFGRTTTALKNHEDRAALEDSVPPVSEAAIELERSLHWSDNDDNTIISYLIANASWQTISNTLSKPQTACQARFMRLMHNTVIRRVENSPSGHYLVMIMQQGERVTLS